MVKIARPVLGNFSKEIAGTNGKNCPVDDYAIDRFFVLNLHMAIFCSIYRHATYGLIFPNLVPYGQIFFFVKWKIFPICIFKNFFV